LTRVLVTGASGFIGRAVVTALTQSGYTVRAAVRRPPRHPFAPDVEVTQQPDLSRSFDWTPLLAHVEAVVHLAGIAHTGRSEIAAALYDSVNRRATAELAAAAARQGIKRFVFVSSIRAQSGPAADHALTENDAPTPTDAYGRSKLAAEAAVRASGVPFTILRPVLLYGPGAKGYFALLLRIVMTRVPLPLRDFVNRRSLLSLDNFTSALIYVLASPATLGETYIVADPGMPPRLADIAATLRKARGRWPLIVALPTQYLETALRVIKREDVWERLGGNLRADPGKLIAAGWQPLHDTRGGLKALVAAASR